MEQFELCWSHGRATVFSDGAMLHRLVFDGDGDAFSPLAEAPWQAQYLAAPHDEWPRHLQVLGGEWACVPFGSTHHDPAHHGYGTDHPWQVVTQASDHITLGLDYPLDHAIKRLERSISGVDGQAAVDLSLTITPRRTGLMPIGLHPIFRLTDDLRILPPKIDHGMTFPKVFEEGASQLRPNARFQQDGLVATDDGDTNVFSAPSALNEDLVQLVHTDGEMVLVYGQENMAVHLTWDAQALPHCLLWISNKGRGAAPWQHQFQGLGVEPINSYFDINDDAPEGQDYGLPLTADQPVTINYRMAASRL